MARSKRENISRLLNEVGAAWAGTMKKCILPNDGYDAKPSYHIHPDVSNPHQNRIRAFSTLDGVVQWAQAAKEAERLTEETGEMHLVETSPDGRESWVEKA